MCSLDRSAKRRTVGEAGAGAVGERAGRGAAMAPLEHAPGAGARPPRLDSEESNPIRDIISNIISKHANFYFRGRCHAPAEINVQNLKTKRRCPNDLQFSETWLNTVAKVCKVGKSVAREGKSW